MHPIWSMIKQISNFRDKNFIGKIFVIKSCQNSFKVQYISHNFNKIWNWRDRARVRNLIVRKFRKIHENIFYSEVLNQSVHRILKRGSWHIIFFGPPRESAFAPSLPATPLLGKLWPCKFYHGRNKRNE